MCAMWPLSVGLLMVRVRCSEPMEMALEVIGARPRPNSAVGRWIASVGKLGVTPNAFLAAALSMASMVASCESLNIPK